MDTLPKDRLEAFLSLLSVDGAAAYLRPQPVSKESLLQVVLVDDWIKLIDALIRVFIFFSVYEIICRHLKDSIESPQFAVFHIDPVEVLLRIEIFLRQLR